MIATEPPEQQDKPEPAPIHERLGHLAREIELFDPQSLKRRSRIVRGLRLLLPLLALILVGLVVAWPEMDRTIEPLQKEVAQSLPPSGSNELINPRFESRDKEGRPFTVTAASAFQGGQEKDRIFLEAPLADMTLDNGAWIAVEADTGNYYQNEKRIELEKNIRLYHDAGYEMRMEALDVDLENRTAVSETNIKGRGPAGTLEAAGMVLKGQTHHLLFKGPAKLVLYPDVGKSPI